MNITLLNCVNELLLTVGELDVPNLNSPVARKARMAIQRGISAVADLHRWSYLQDNAPPLSITGNVLDVPISLNRISLVSFKNQALEEASRLDVQTAFLQNPSAGTPRYYARETSRSLRIYPAVLPAQLPDILVHGTLEPTLPQAVGDSIIVPDNVYVCVMLHAEVIMHRIHTDDIDALQAAQAEFETKLHYARTLDGNDGRFG